MKFLVLMILIISFSVSARGIDLPRGGKIQVDSKTWTVLENKVTPELRSMIIFHKGDENLRGFILDGSIKNKSACKKSAEKSWSACEQKQKVQNEIHHQVYLQRKIGKDSYQNYVVSFNYDVSKEKEYSNKISKLKASLEMK